MACFNFWVNGWISRVKIFDACDFILQLVIFLYHISIHFGWREFCILCCGLVGNGGLNYHSVVLVTMVATGWIMCFEAHTQVQVLCKTQGLSLGPCLTWTVEPWSKSAPIEIDRPKPAHVHPKSQLNPDTSSRSNSKFICYKVQTLIIVLSEGKSVHLFVSVEPTFAWFNPFRSHASLFCRNWPKVSHWFEWFS